MKPGNSLPLIALLIAILLSAGCVALGSQTTDIVMQNETFGSLQITPMPDGSYEVNITLFGVTVSRNGLSLDETTAITDTLENGNLDLTCLLPLQIPENIGTPTDIDAFIDSIIHMPLTNTGDRAVADSFSFENLQANANETVSNLETLISDIFGI